MEKLTLEDVVSAYRKLKAMSYHDNSDLFLRWKIAEFESGEGRDVFLDPMEKLIDVFENLKGGEGKKSIKFWHKQFDGIGYYILPKEVKTFGEYENSESGRSDNDQLIKNIFTNIREVNEDSKYDIKKVTIFFEAPIEVYLISILWVMKFGYKLDIELDDKCFGNRLLLKEDAFGEKRLVKDEGLFKPYYKQYQKWRDEGILTAKHYLDKGEDVLFVNLDIKNYYYSVRIQREQVDAAIDQEASRSVQYVNDLFWSLHDVYTKQVKRAEYPEKLIFRNENENILPIGLPSSYVLANWYLKDFDVRVNEFINPVYYSRYVDDIFIVTAHNDLTFDFSERMSEEERRLMNSMSQLSSNEKYIIGLLSPILKLEAYAVDEEGEMKIQQTIQDNIGSSDYRFSVTGYEHLYIQAAKTLVYFFDPAFSLALLDKFKNELESRSSEFRFLPDDELNKSGFDDDAYELVFEDSQYKIKTLKDYKESRYGIASHLSKKIFYTLRNGSKGTNEDAEKIVKFFSGTSNLEHYRQWERLMTYLVINEKKKLLSGYVIYTLKQLNDIDLPEITRKSKLRTRSAKISLTQQFLLALNMALSLAPDLALSSDADKVIHASQMPNPLILKTRKLFRSSNLIRHNYVSTPLANYLIGIDELSLSSFGLDQLPDSDVGGFDPEKMAYSPRKVKFCEVAWMECVLRIRQRANGANAQVDDLLFGNKTYLDQAFDNYYQINYWHEEDNAFKESLRKEIFEYQLIDRHQFGDLPPVEVHEVAVSPKGVSGPGGKGIKNPMIGLVNMTVKEQNYKASMLSRPNLNDRYQEFAKILNMAETDSCDILALPELALPPALVKTFLDNSWSHQRCIVTGLEHWTSRGVAFNFVLTILPFENHGIKDAVPILRLKNHYSPYEDFWVKNHHKTVPKPVPPRYHLFRWKGYYFSIFYCFELSNVFHRSIFKSKIDFLIASEWNPDVNYFSNIAEVSARDLHCYFIQVNTNPYGDSRIVSPSKTESKDVLRIKGGQNITLLTDELKVDELRNFQYKGYGLQKDDKSFKPTPADFDPEDVLMRQEGKSFSK